MFTVVKGCIYSKMRSPGAGGGGDDISGYVIRGENIIGEQKTGGVFKSKMKKGEEKRKIEVKRGKNTRKVHMG
jgi:hypothetical protein